jgi:microcompartment protein CcmK/EutM
VGVTERAPAIDKRGAGVSAWFLVSAGSRTQGEGARRPDRLVTLIPGALHVTCRKL